MELKDLASSLQSSQQLAADRIKAQGLEIASLYGRLAKANEQVVGAIQLLLKSALNLDRPTIDKYTADMHGAMVAAENYAKQAGVVKEDAIARSLASAQAGVTTDSSNTEQTIAAAVAAIEVSATERLMTLPVSSDGKYEYWKLATGTQFWLEIGGGSPNCIWQLTNQVPYRSGTLDEVTSDGTAIYGCNSTAHPETHWRSIDGTNWEQIDADIYLQIARSETKEASLSIPLPDFNFVPKMVVYLDPTRELPVFDGDKPVITPLPEQSRAATLPQTT